MSQEIVEAFKRALDAGTAETSRRCGRKWTLSWSGIRRGDVGGRRSDGARSPRSIIEVPDLRDLEMELGERRQV